MKKAYAIFVLTIVLGIMTLSSVSCGKKEAASPKKTHSKKNAPSAKTVLSEDEKKMKSEVLAYIPIVNAAVSSFDITPDWAPEPNPMAVADRNETTRWSSDYSPGEQWISLDLGKESVISNVIIRWERAYATSFDIAVSMDGKKWKTVSEERNSPGGVFETYFSPVKCRFVKITGIEKVNKAWGISIWEVEVYGPNDQNAHAKVMKNKLLARGDKKTEEEMAKKLIEQAAGPLVPITPKSFQKGIVYTSWMADELALPVSDITLARVKGLGYDTVAIMVPAYQDALDSTLVFTNDKPNGDTPTDKALKHAIKTSHELGLRVMIKPHVDPRTDEARINIMPSEAWFDSYEALTVRYAVLAEENKVEMFSIGTELEATTFETWTPRWNRIIAKVKENYSGVLTYSANWTEYQEVPFWEKMDFIGIDAYFPLTETNNPSLEELKSAWTREADKIEKWLTEKKLTDKGVLFTEVGYPSADGASRQPWVAITKVTDEKEQAECLQAMFESVSTRPWFKGYYIWQYFPQDRWSPLGFTVKGKKAEEVIVEWMKRT
ncbi:MAG: discoidin domain-containing protein [Candidatus Omnitrophica bacterium]|nr:discoidin domain-containing protein [Candidatus Omnitrophota bacterium]